MTKFLTKESLEKFKKELAFLKNDKRKEISARLKYTAGFGDLSENFAYHQAKDDQAFLEAKIRQLQEIIANAKVLDGKTDGTVRVGCLVTVDYDGKKENFEIVEPEETDPFNGRISYKSPLGESLMGKSVGMKGEIKMPAGKTQYKIIEIK